MRPERMALRVASPDLDAWCASALRWQAGAGCQARGRCSGADIGEEVPVPRRTISLTNEGSVLLGESASFEMEKGASMELQTGSINIIK